MIVQPSMYLVCLSSFLLVHTNIHIPMARINALVFNLVLILIILSPHKTFVVKPRLMHTVQMVGRALSTLINK